MKDQLKLIKQLSENVLKELEETPEKEHIANLIQACETIDLHYEEMCSELDDNFGDEPGTSYKNGVSIEYYIEAAWWHEVSVALRKLRNEKS